MWSSEGHPDQAGIQDLFQGFNLRAECFAQSFRKASQGADKKEIKAIGAIVRELLQWSSSEVAKPQ